MKTLDGYVISKELKAGKLVKLGAEETTTYTLKTKFVGKVVLTKTDAHNKEKLKNAVFSA